MGWLIPNCVLDCPLHSQPLDVVFYGDSIAETWRGTDMGRECGRCQGGPEIFHKYFGSRYSAKVFAVGGAAPAYVWPKLSCPKAVTGSKCITGCKLQPRKMLQVHSSCMKR